MARLYTKKLWLAVLMALVSIGAMADDVTLTYCNGKASEALGGNFTKSSAAVVFPASEVAALKGGKLQKLRCHISDVSTMTSLTLWVRNSLKGSNLASVTVSSPKAGWNEVELPTPVEIASNKDLVMGYTFTQSSRAYCISICDVVNANGLWLQVEDGEWTDYAEYGYESLCMEGTVTSVNATEYKLAIASLEPDDAFAQISSTTSLTMEVKNMGKAFSSLTFSVECDGVETTSQSFNVSIPLIQSQKLTVTLATPALANPNVNVRVKLTAIDGNAYTGAEVKAQAQLGVFSKLYPRNVVIEEGTGTWCGWCVRGMVAMEQMKKKYPDTFIGIAVHDGNNDPMAIDEYPAMVSGFPGCNVDRSLMGYSVSPEWFEYLYSIERNRQTYADFTMSGFYDNGKVYATATAQFDYDNTDADYRIVYAVKEDGVTGYAQQNYYAGGGYGEMGGFESKPSVVRDAEFNDVARAIYPSYYGKRGSLPLSVKAGTAYKYEASFSLPASIQSYDRLTLVAMLLDGKSGEIIQAHQMPLKQGDASAIDGLESGSQALTATRHGSTITVGGLEPGETAMLYTTGGMAVGSCGGGMFTAAGRGVYIIKTSRGRTLQVAL